MKHHFFYNEKCLHQKINIHITFIAAIHSKIVKCECEIPLQPPTRHMTVKSVTSLLPKCRPRRSTVYSSVRLGLLLFSPLSACRDRLRERATGRRQSSDRRAPYLAIVRGSLLILLLLYIYFYYYRSIIVMLLL